MFRVRTWTGKTAFLTPKAFVREAKEAVEYTMAVLESAPFGDELTVLQEPVTDATIVIDERTMGMVINLTNWARASDTPNTEWQCMLLGNELQGELNQLAWIALELGGKTRHSFKQMLKVCQH